MISGLIKTYFKQDLAGLDHSKDLKSFAIDSFAFLNLRLELEGLLGGAISDDDWTAMKTLGDLVKLANTVKPAVVSHNAFEMPADTTRRVSGDGEFIGVTRHVTIDMPQMSLGGLSESWFAKEMGDVHWEMIGKGVGQSSKDMVDSKGRRLYATFTRLKYSFAKPISEVDECDTGVIRGTLSLFGSSLCFSTIRGKIGTVDFICRAMTTFSAREVEHKNDLLKSSPAKGFSERTLREPFYPEFAQEYKYVYGLEEADGQLAFMGATRDLSFSKTVYEKTDKPIDPYMHINGANLLYFASYHHINDIFERDAMQKLAKTDIALNRAVTHRDIFYFSNSELHNSISYQLTDHVDINEKSVLTVSKLKNKDSGKTMAVIITGRDNV